MLNRVLSPDAQGGHQDALRHLRGLEGLLVGFRLSFRLHPLRSVAILGRGSALYSVLSLLFTACVTNIPLSLL